MSTVSLPWSMEQDRANQVKANSLHVDDNFNTLANAVNGKLDLDGTSVPTANISMGSHKITNIATPTASGDAATKGYADSQVSTLSGTCVKLSGAQTIADVKTFTSSPVVPTPTTNMQASTKKYVDDNITTLSNACVKLSGTQTITGAKTFSGSTTFSGSVSHASTVAMGSNKITNLGTPSSSTDAANKSYVDSAITTATKIASASQLGQVKIGTNVNVNSSGVISVNDATTSQKGVVQLGRTNTTGNAAVAAVRNTVITNTVPTTGTDGVIYFVYAA